MTLRGDCLSCEKVSTCSETDTDKVLNGHTCPLFRAVSEPVYLARLEMMKKYGERIAVEAMIERPKEKEDVDGGSGI